MTLDRPMCQKHPSPADCCKGETLKMRTRPPPRPGILALAALAALEPLPPSAVVCLSAPWTRRPTSSWAQSSPDATSSRSRTPPPRPSRLRAQHGVDADSTFDSAVGGFAARMSYDQAAALDDDPAVRSVEPNRIVHLADETLPTGIVRVEAGPAGDIDRSIPLLCPANDSLHPAVHQRPQRRHAERHRKRQRHPPGERRVRVSA